LVLAIAILIAVFDWNWLKGPIERRVQVATGRSFVIKGDLAVNLGMRPRIRAEGVQLGNASWSSEPVMVQLDRVEMRIALWPLLRGQVDIPYVSLQRPDLLIERNRDGEGNWAFAGKKSGSAGNLPLIRELRVNDGKLRVHEPVLKTDLSLTFASAESSSKTGRAPLVAHGAGTYRGDPFKLAARVDSPLDLADKDRPYRIELTASAGETRAHMSGALHGQLQLQSLDLHFDLAGPDLADLYQLVGIPLPQTAAYSLTGQLQRDGDVWSYRKFKGKVGNSDLEGDASIDIGGERPKLKADLVSTRLTFKDLAGFVGGGPGEPTAVPTDVVDAPVLGKSAPPSKRQAKLPTATPDSLPGPRVLPDTPYKLDKLRVMDADVNLLAASIDAPKLPLEKMSAHLLLRNGVLELNPLDFDAAGGRIASRITLDAREVSIQTTATAEVYQLDLAKLFPTVQITRRGAGRLSGAIALTAQGNSIARMLGSANGDIGLIMGQGHISNLLVELAGLDIAESLKFLIEKDREIPLRCAFADFKIEDGLMSSRGLAFDTTDTVIYGSGTVNLRQEGIDLRLLPQPKDRSPLAMRVPLKIGGTFKDPSFHPEAGPLILRGAAAAALYSVAPPAALLALIETGPGKNESLDCTLASGKAVTASGEE
jgi:uncharacterized protein involved in outer membrane biogenesis